LSLQRSFASSSAIITRHEEETIEASSDSGSHKKTLAPSSASSSSASSHSHSSQLRVSDILRRKQNSVAWVDPVVVESATLREAVGRLIEDDLYALMVVQASEVTKETNAPIRRTDSTSSSSSSSPNNAAASRKIVGMITGRDLLKGLAASYQQSSSTATIVSVRDCMTPISQVVFGRPDEKVHVVQHLLETLGLPCMVCLCVIYI
jgi:CBS domain-containing protein